MCCGGGLGTGTILQRCNACTTADVFGAAGGNAADRLLRGWPPAACAGSRLTCDLTVPSEITSCSAIRLVRRAGRSPRRLAPVAISASTSSSRGVSSESIREPGVAEVRRRGAGRIRARPPARSRPTRDRRAPAATVSIARRTCSRWSRSRPSSTARSKICPKPSAKAHRMSRSSFVDDSGLVVGVQEADHAPGRHQRRGDVGLQPARLDHRAEDAPVDVGLGDHRGRVAAHHLGLQQHVLERDLRRRPHPGAERALGRAVADGVALPRPPGRVLDPREHRAVEPARVHDGLAHLRQQLVRIVDPAQRREPGLERLEPVEPLVHLVVVHLGAEGLQVDERRAELGQRRAVLVDRAGRQPLADLGVEDVELRDEHVEVVGVLERALLLGAEQLLGRAQQLAAAAYERRAPPHHRGVRRGGRVLRLRSSVLTSSSARGPPPNPWFTLPVHCADVNDRFSSQAGSLARSSVRSRTRPRRRSPRPGWSR